MKVKQYFIWASIFCSSLSSAQSQEPVNSGWGFAGYVQSISIDSKVAESQGIDDSATIIGFTGERYTNANNRTLHLGLDILIYGDNAGFSQETENELSGDRQTSDSSARGFLLFFDYGPRYTFGNNNANSATIRGGISMMVSSERSIGGCTNCDSQDIDVDGGVYALAGIDHSFGSVALGLQVQQYLSGDLGTGIGIKLSSSY